MTGELWALIDSEHASLEAYARSCDGESSDDGIPVTIKRLRAQFDGNRSSPPDWSLVKFIVKTTISPESGDAPRLARLRELWEEQQSRVDPRIVELQQRRDDESGHQARVRELLAQIEQGEVVLEGIRRQLEDSHRGIGLEQLARQDLDQQLKDLRREWAAAVADADSRSLELELAAEVELRLRTRLTQTERSLAQLRSDLRMARTELDERQNEIARFADRCARADARRQLDARLKGDVARYERAREASALRTHTLVVAGEGVSGGPRKSRRLEPVRSGQARYLAVYLDTCAGLRQQDPIMQAATAGLDESMVEWILCADLRSQPRAHTFVTEVRVLAQLCGADPDHAAEVATLAGHERAGELPTVKPGDRVLDGIGNFLTWAPVFLVGTVGAVIVGTVILGPIALLSNASPTAPPNTIFSGPQPLVDLTEPVCMNGVCTGGQTEADQLQWRLNDNQLQSVEIGRIPEWYESGPLPFYQLDGTFSISNQSECSTGVVDWSIRVPGGTQLASGRIDSNQPEFEGLSKILTPDAGTTSIRVEFRRVDAGPCAPVFEWDKPELNFSGRDAWFDLTVSER